MARRMTLLFRIFRCAGLFLLGLILFFLWVWTALAIYYSNLPSSLLRTVSAGAFALGILAAFVFFRNRRHAVAILAVSFLLVLAWWVRIPASNDRDWTPDVLVLPRAHFDGDTVAVRNIRNFDYTENGDFTIRYYDKTFDLKKLERVYFVISYWEGVKAIAHTFLSFGFTGGDYLAVSVEVRRLKGKKYGVLQGFFKQYEIAYMIADERDVIRVRTNYRGEDVYLFPTTLTPEQGRALLVDILKRANRLAEEPEFYHTFGRNCTTSLVDHLNAVLPEKVPYHRKILMNGYTPELAYQRGRIASDLPFEETKRRCAISEIAKTCDENPDFSKKIRAQLP